jgi:hypothetical protein
MDGDTFLDIAAINSGSGNLGFLAGDGTGGFADPQLFKVPAKPTALAAGKINGDANFDLGVAHASGGVTVLLGNGTGFDTPATFKTGGKNSTDVAIGDFNRDTFVDIVAVNSSSNNVSFLADSANAHVVRMAGRTKAGADFMTKSRRPQ